LRQVDDEVMEKEATLFPVRKALWYIERRTLGGSGQASQGNAYYIAENPPFGAVFTYYLADGLKSLEDQRREGEKKLEKEWKDTPYVGWDALQSAIPTAMSCAPSPVRPRPASTASPGTSPTRPPVRFGHLQAMNGGAAAVIPTAASWHRPAPTPSHY
jgi:hypothetical protein